MIRFNDKIKQIEIDEENIKQFEGKIKSGSCFDFLKK